MAAGDAVRKNYKFTMQFLSRNQIESKLPEVLPQRSHEPSLASHICKRRTISIVIQSTRLDHKSSNISHVKSTIKRTGTRHVFCASSRLQPIADRIPHSISAAGRLCFGFTIVCVGGNKLYREYSNISLVIYWKHDWFYLTCMLFYDKLWAFCNHALSSTFIQETTLCCPKSDGFGSPELATFLLSQSLRALVNFIIKSTELVRNWGALTVAAISDFNMISSIKQIRT